VNPLVPRLATIAEIIPETGSQDVKTFIVSLVDAQERFAFRPGQCVMVSVFGVGESMISICSGGSQENNLEMSVKKAGRVTSALHELERGCTIGVRGPYGNGFPAESWYGRNILLIGGGIGLAPLRPLVISCLRQRERFGDLRLVYGARSPQDLCFKRDLFGTWAERDDLSLDLTVDIGDEGWTGAVGVVPRFLDRLSPAPENTVAVVCGPPVMIKYTLRSLERLGFRDDQVFVTLEVKMQCGLGTCGRCNIGSRYVCVDGPVFALEQLRALPQEY